MRFAKGIDKRDCWPFRTHWLIPVIDSISGASSSFVPIAVQLLSKKMTLAGAMSSCKVQPLVHHLQFRSVGTCSFWKPGARSDRNAKQIVAFLYQRNIELMHSESSALEDLSMQQVSIQMYARP